MKYRLGLILIVCLLVIVISGCSQNDVDTDTDVKSSGNVEEPADSNQTHVVTDHLGIDVEVPNDIERIVVVGPLPLPTVLTVYQGGNPDNIVGVDPDSVNGAEHTIFSQYAPEFLNISTDFYQGGELNLEELVELEPDVVFYSGAQMTEPLNTTGIASVAFPHPNNGGTTSTLGTLEQWMDLIEKVLQEESSAKEIIEYGKQVENEIADRVKDVPEEERSKLLFISNYTDVTLNIMGKNSFGQYWSEMTGSINVAETAANNQVNMEQIYEWRPDKIFISTFTEIIPDDLYNNAAAPGHDWSSVPAVQNKECYKFPFGMHRWEPPTTDTPLSMWWVAKATYPELFSDIIIEDEIKEFYNEFYGMELTDDDVEWILNPSRDTKRSNM